MRVSVWGPSPSLRPTAAPASIPTADVRQIVFAGKPLLAAVFPGEPPPGAVLLGPALCALPDATLLVPPGWSGQVDEFGTIHLRDLEAG